MSSNCFVTGKRVQYGHQVSHSNIKTSKRFKANMFKKSFFSEALNRDIVISVSARGIRTIRKYVSIDNFVLTYGFFKLTPDAVSLRRDIQSKMKKEKKLAK